MKLRALRYTLLILAVCGITLLLRASLPTVATGTWVAEGNMAAARSGACTAVLSDGRLLISGGADANVPTNTADLFSTTGSWSAAAKMSSPRSYQSCAVLPDGRVLVAGGTSSNGVITNSAELYDASADTWTPAAYMNDARSGATASVLQDGRVLIIGGQGSAAALNTLEIFDPNADTFSHAGTLASPRQDHAAAVLQDGRVLIAGGSSDGTNALNTTEIYDPQAGSVSAGPAMSTARARHTATTLLDGTVIVIGGTDYTNDLASAEVFDPVANNFSAASNLATARSKHSAFLLPKNNEVLVVGGQLAGSDLGSAELYIPWQKVFQATGAMATARSDATGAALTSVDGRLLIAGGVSASAELYGFATVKTDAADYPPGTTVNITGSGWQPGETVTLTLVESPLIDNHGPFTTIADAFGNISDSSFVTDSHDVNVKFSLTAVGSQSQAQNTFTDAAKNKLVFTTPASAFTIKIGQCSPAIVVQSQDNQGAALPVGNNFTVSLTSNSSVGTFYSASNCTSSITTVTIPSGSSSSSSFYYSDTAVGTTQSPKLTASTTVMIGGAGYDDATQTETVTPKLAITSSAFTVATGVCSPLITIATEDNSNNLVSPPKVMTVNLQTSSATGAFYTTSACTSTQTSVTIAANSTSASFYYKDTTGGTPSITASDAANAANSAAQIETISGAPKLIFSSTAFSANSTQCSPVITVQSRQSDGTTPLNVSGALTVNLSSNSPGPGPFGFFSDATCSTSTSSVTIASGTSTTPSFYYMDSNPGTPTLTAAATGYTSGTQMETITNLAKVGSTTVGTQSGTLNSGTGGSATYLVTVNRAAGGNFTAALCIPTWSPSQPTGVTFSFSPASVSFPNATNSGTSTLTITTTNATPPAITNFTVRASNPGGGQTCTTATDHADATGTLTVGQGATSTTVASSVNPSAYGQSVTFTATVSGPGTATPTGSVTFKDGTTTLGTGSVSTTGGVTTATFTTTATQLAIGSHSITAVYGGDTNFASSTSPALSQVVNPARTTTVLASSVNPSVFGQSVMFTAAVTINSPGTGSVPSGDTVTFKDGATTLGTGSTNASGIATLSTSALSVATHSITAVYAGDTNLATSTSSALSQVVNPASTTTTLMSSANPSVFGQTVTFTATVTVNSPGTGTVPSGETVTFKDGATSLGTGTTNASGVATVSTSSLNVSTHSITAAYAGDTNLASSTSSVLSQVVSAASTTTSISAPTVMYPANATITVTVSSTAGTPSGNVSLTVDGGTALTQSLNNGVAVFTLTSPNGGSHNLSASYAAQGNFAASSTSGSLTVNQATPTVTFTGAPVSAYFNSQFTVSASTNASTTATITASGSCTIAGTKVTVTSGLGTCSLQASWAADTNYVAATATQSTNAQQVLVTVSVPDTTVIYDGTPKSITPTVTPAVAYAVTYTGISPTVYATSSSAPTEPGSYTVATTVTDPNYVGSGSGTLTISQKDPVLSLVLLTGMPEPSSYGTRVYFELMTANSPCPTGQVQFFVDSDSTPSSTVALSNSPCTTQPIEFSTATLTPGTHTVTAVYSGDTYYLGKTSAPVSHQVIADTTTVTLATSAMTVFVGDAVTLTATVTPSTSVDGTATTPSGTVQFYDGPTLLGQNPLSSNTATFTTSSLSAGSHSMTATFVSANGDFTGNSSPVDVETVDKITPTINWPNPADIVYGTKLSAIQLNATATDTHNHIPITGTFTYNPAADTVLPVGTRNLTLTFTPDDTATYASQSATATINVTAATLTVTADDASRFYGADNPMFTSQYSGFVNGEGSGIVTMAPTCSTTADSKSSVGTYDITCSGAVAPNYTITYVKGKLTVNPALLTITANDQTKAYGTNLTLGSTAFTTSGLVNSDTVASVTLSSAGAAATATVGGSPYTITPSAAVGTGLGNYTISYVNAKLTVNPAALTITAKDAAKNYGQTMTFAGTEFAASGLLNSDTVASVTLTSTGTVATATVGGSPYTITPSAAVGTGLGNYTISYVNGKLTVNPAALIITAKDATKNYGQTMTFAGIEFTPTGLLNSDIVTSVTLTSAGAAATATVSGSPYTITPSAAVGTGLGNYTISYLCGKLTVNPAALTITAKDATKNYGQTVTFAGTEFTPSGLLNSDTVTSVTLTSAGAAATATVGGSPYTITPSAAVSTSLGNYTISYVNGKLTVNPALLTITAIDQTKAYGTTPTLGSTAFTPSGLLNSDMVASVTLTSTGTAATAAVSGSPYSIVPSAAMGTGLGNYTISYVNGKLTVNPATLTLNVVGASGIYNALPFTAACSVATGLVNGDSVTLTITYSSGIAPVNVGAYTATCTSSGNSNYQTASGQASIMITAAPLTITGDNQSMTFGGTTPGFTASYSGFQGSDTSAVVSGLTFTVYTDNTLGTAVTDFQSLKAGSYPIVPSGAMAANYSIQYGNGTLTVNKAMLTGSVSVTPADPSTVAYGQPVTATVLLNSYSIGGVPVLQPHQDPKDPNQQLPESLTVYLVPVSGGPSQAMKFGTSTAVPTYDNTTNTSGTTKTGWTASVSGKAPTPGNYTAVVYGDDPGDGSLTNLNLADAGYFYPDTADIIYPTLQSNQLDVVPAALTITANNASKIYGVTVTFVGNEFNTNGLVNTDTVNSVTLTSAGAAAIATVSGSPYAIVPSAAAGTGLSNYTISYVNGTLTVTRAHLTVTADNQARFYGDANPMFTATITGFANGEMLASSGVTGSANCTSVATPTSAVPGPYSITCTAGTLAAGNYDFTTFNPGQLTVNKAHLTVTADNQNRFYGDANPAFTTTLSGFKNGETLATSGVTGSANCTTTATPTSAVPGPYSINCTVGTLAAGNYDFTPFNPGQLTLNKAHLTVTGDNQSRFYGDANPALTATISGFKNGETLATSGVTGMANCTTTATPTSAVPGPYSINCTAGTLAAGNYDFTTFNSGQLTINQRLITATADPQTKIYGKSDPALTYKITSGNLVNGDVFTGALNRAIGENVGTYAILQGTLALSGNYKLTYAGANLTITPAPLTITASGATVNYGAAVPAITAGYTGFVNGDAAGSLTTAPICTTVAHGGSAVGSYATNCSGAVDSNYIIGYTAGTVTIQAVPLTITASSPMVNYGSAVPTITPGYAGFVNNDTAASLTTQPICLTTATSLSPVGTYLSSCSGAADSNYTIAYVAGVVTVMPATTTAAVASSVSPSTYMQLVTLTATLTPQYAGTTPTGSVTFYNNGSQIGTGTLSAASCGTPPCPDQATFSTSSLPDIGPDSITAMYSGDGNFVGSTSPAITQTVQPAPNVSLSPMSVSFGNQNVNTTSAPGKVTLTNIGDAALNISSNGFLITGSDYTEFAQTNNCGSTVAAGKSCTITISFTPTYTGVASASLQITDNDDDATNAQQIVSLTGAGLSTISGGSLYTDALFATAGGCGSILASGGSTVDSFSSVQGYSSSHILSGGNVGTNGNVTLNGSKSMIYGSAAVDTMLTGNCSKTSVTGITTSGGAQVTGGAVALNGPINYPAPPAPSPVPPTTTQNISGSCGSISGCSNTGTKTVSLAPGQYGNLSISGGTTAHVSTGTYNINSLTLSGNSILYVDSGPVVVNLAGASLSGANPAMDASGGSIQNPSGKPSNLQFTYAGSRGLTLSGGSNSYAVVYAPNALVNISGGSDFFGSIIGSTVTATGGTATHFDTSLADIQPENYILFTAVVNNVNNLGSGQVKLYLTNSSIQFTGGGTVYTVPVPNAVVTFNAASQSSGAKTTYDLTNSRWSTAVAKTGLTGNTFVAGVAFKVPTDFPTGIQNATWSASFSTDTQGVNLQWQWGAAVYGSAMSAACTSTDVSHACSTSTYATTSPSNTNVLGINAEDGSANANGTDPAGTPEAYKASVIFGAMGGGLTNYTGYRSSAAAVVPTIAPMSVSPSSLDFGTQNQGTTTATPLTAVLTNNDSNQHNFTGSGIQMMGTNAADFTLVPNGPGTLNNCLATSSLASGASCTLYATFTPGDVGTRTAKIVLNDDANNSPQTVYLSGTGQ